MLSDEVCVLVQKRALEFWLQWLYADGSILQNVLSKQLYWKFQSETKLFFIENASIEATLLKSFSNDAFEL